MKLTKKQIEKIRELSKEGKSQTEISRMMNIPPSTIRYWMNEEARVDNIERAKGWYKNQSEDKRTEMNLKKKDYRQNYYKQKYWKDEEYRKKRIEYSKKYNHKKKVTNI